MHQQTFGGQRQTWQLDANQRFRSWKVETGSGQTWTQTASKVNHYDGDGDNPRWITEDIATGALTRNVDTASGDMGAITTKTGDTVLQLSNIHGDVALQLPLDISEAPVALDADEYGNARAGQAPTRYNWLGAKQRSAETLTGLTLMGVRLYNPQAGRFLSLDPVYGGSANAYDYTNADPLNQYDLDGRWGCGWCKKAGRWAWKNKWNIGATALTFAPGGQFVVAARVAYTGYRAYRLARSAKFASRALRSARYGGLSYRYGNISVANYGRARNARQLGTAAGRWNHQARRVKVGWNYNKFAGRPTFRVGWRWRNKPRHFNLF